MTPQQAQREGWIDEQTVTFYRRHPEAVGLAIRILLRDAMAFADAHPDSESLEQPSPMRIVDSSASDHTSYDFNSPSKTPTPPPREQGDKHE